jgi:hypothetical protein
MSVAKGRRQFVIVDRPAAVAGRPADWRETSLRPPLSATKWIAGYSDVMHLTCSRRCVDVANRRRQSWSSYGPLGSWANSLRMADDPGGRLADRSSRRTVSSRGTRNDGACKRDRRGCSKALHGGTRRVPGLILNSMLKCGIAKLKTLSQGVWTH